MSVTRAELKNVKLLGTKKGRRARKAFSAEGVRLLEEALRHKFPPTVLYCVPRFISDRGERLVAEFRRRKVPIRHLSLNQMQTVTDTKSPSGVLAVFGLPVTEPGELFRPAPRRVILCDGLSDPGNLGTLIRSALAFRFELMLLVGASVEPFSPKVVRASAGAIFGLPVAGIRPQQLWSFVNRQNLVMIATTTSAGSDDKKLASALKSGRILLAIGSESEGLTDEITQHADFKWRIKHSTAVESLNAAVAGSIIMKQVYDACL